MTDTTTRPGGWMNGIGWVALLCNLTPGDVWAPHLPPAQPTYTIGKKADGTIGDSVPSSPSVVIVTRWADGTAPTEPAPTGLEPGEIVAVPADLRVELSGSRWEWLSATKRMWFPCDVVATTGIRHICRPIQDGDPR